jgi:hypothetical protein
MKRKFISVLIALVNNILHLWYRLMLALRLIMQASKDVIKTIKCHHIGMLIWQAVKVY